MGLTADDITEVRIVKLENKSVKNIQNEDKREKEKVGKYRKEIYFV